jgi:flavin reductase (DIM6/NTAB) family NADH-FMN oxidoreductase RutF
MYGTDPQQRRIPMREKINLGNDAFIYPMSVTLVGANVNGRPNFMTVAWVSRVNALYS